jgi:WhiB family transcriptional regulator, redox-sensing transcriptional regulator
MVALRRNWLIACGLWRQFAACLSTDPELFYPVSATGAGLRQAEEAKAICTGCQVRSQCLTFATLTRQEHGIWGGLTQEERRAAVRRSRAAEGWSYTGHRRTAAWNWWN